MILVNANWPTLSVVNDLKASFFPEIDLCVDAQDTNLTTVPSKDSGEEKRIDDDWINLNIVPLSHITADENEIWQTRELKQ